VRGLGFTWVRSIPPAVQGAGLFDPTPDPGPSGMRSLRLSWALRGLSDPDAGLVCAVFRRPG
jgi:hypothetical protein